MFCWLIFVHVFTFIFRCSSKKLFCWLIFVHVFTLTISLKGALFTKICLHMFYYVFVRTSGEATLGTLKYVYLRMLNKTNKPNKQTKLSQQKTLTEGGFGIQSSKSMWWLSKTGLESHLMCIVTASCLVSRLSDSIHWFDSLVRFIGSIHCFHSLIRFVHSMLWFDS